MKKIFFYLITVFVFLPTFVEAAYKTFEIQTDNGMKYSIDYSSYTLSDCSFFKIRNDNYNLTVTDVADSYKSIDYEKYSVEKIKNGFAILYDKAERIKFIYDLGKKIWTIVLHGANSTSKYSAEVSIIESNSQTLFNNIYRWGEGSSNNKKIFLKMEVIYNNEQFGVPFSAYCNMADMRNYHIYPTIDGFGLIIDGGDTAEHYIAKLIFKKGFLMRKEIRNSELYDELWEQIFYSHNELEN